MFIAEVSTGYPGSGASRPGNSDERAKRRRGTRKVEPCQKDWPSEASDSLVCYEVDRDLNMSALQAGWNVPT